MNDADVTGDGHDEHVIREDDAGYYPELCFGAIAQVTPSHKITHKSALFWCYKCLAFTRGTNLCTLRRKVQPCGQRRHEEKRQLACAV